MHTHNHQEVNESHLRHSLYDGWRYFNWLSSSLIYIVKHQFFHIKYSLNERLCDNNPHLACLSTLKRAVEGNKVRSAYHIKRPKTEGIEIVIFLRKVSRTFF